MSYSYEEAKEYILDIPRFTSKNEPEKTKAFLNYLGDISLKIPTVHIAGTNGKGSVCAFISSICKEAGMKVAMFTSPHLVSIRERFLYDGEMISKEDFTLYFNQLMDKVASFNAMGEYEDFHPTYFEFLFFMGVLYFEKLAPDILLLETGLGGRLDATNSIESPIVCVITEIGLDHMEYLGDSVDKIAAEKAGIIKKGIPVVYINKPISGPVIAKKADELMALSYPIDSNSYKIINYTYSGIDFLMASRYHKNVNFTVAGFAPYQVENAALAYRAIEVISEERKELKLSEQAIYQGILKMNWPGRMEKVKDNLIIDGAHNEDGIEAFLKSVSMFENQRKVILYSAVGDKQVEEITGKIIDSNLFDKYYVAVLDSYRAADEDRLKACFEKVSDRAEYFSSVSEAVDTMLDEVDNKTMCFAAGSLYLVGEIKRKIDDKL